MNKTIGVAWAALPRLTACGTAALLASFSPSNLSGLMPRIQRGTIFRDRIFKMLYGHPSSLCPWRG